MPPKSKLWLQERDPNLFILHLLGQAVIQVDWALLPLLDEGIQTGLVSTGNTSTAPASTSTCPQRSIQDFQKRILQNPLNHRYTSSAVTSPHQEYFPENELRQASWSAPAAQLVEHLEWARLGTAADVAVDLIGSCFYPYWKGDTGRGQGGSASFLSTVNFTTYIGK